MSNNQISINNLSKVYDNGFEGLKNINLDIKKGEIFAMLVPNGAGKNVATTKDKNNKDCKIKGAKISLGNKTPTSRLFEKSGNGNIKKPDIKPTKIAK